MKKKIKLVVVWLLLSICLFSLAGCNIENNNDNIQSDFRIEESAKESATDYINEEILEEYLNKGVDTKGKTVKFVVKDYVPKSAFGCNSQAGEHLNFISETDLKLKKDDEVIGKIVSTKKVLGSWIIDYEVLQINTKNTEDINEIKENNNTIANEVKESSNNKIENEITKRNDTPIKENSQTQQTTTKTPTKKVDENKNTTSTTKTPVTTTNSNLVWIPQSGKKYHSNPKCSNMKNPSQVTKASAESSGYTPCKKCY